MELVNSSIVSIIASIVIGIVIFQSIKLIQLAAKASEGAGMGKQEVNSALKTEAIAAIGPSSRGSTHFNADRLKGFLKLCQLQKNQ